MNTCLPTWIKMKVRRVDTHVKDDGRAIKMVGEQLGRGRVRSMACSQRLIYYQQQIETCPTEYH